MTFSGWLRRVGYWFTWWPWRCLAVRWWQRRTRGFDDTECWNLDCTMAEWLAPRLDALADMAHTTPAGYPLARGDEGFELRAKSHDGADHEAWVADLKRVAQLLRTYADAEGLEASYKAEKGVDEAMVWIAKWWRALWD